MRKANLNILVAVCVLIMALARPGAAVIHYVDPNDSNDFTTIQAAIDDPCTVNGDEIEVAPGTYNEAINFIGKAITLRSSNPNDPNIVAATVIDGTGSYHVVQCVTGEEPNTVLSGFTITGGDANGFSPDDRGGGMYNNSSSPTVTNCTFSGNTADYGGAGMGNEYSSLTVTNCTFSGNTADYGGAGMGNNYSSPTVTNCTFSGNNAAVGGGGMGNLSSSPTVTNCTFSGNAASGGGGMYSELGNPTVTNCTFSGNSATSYGGGMYNYSSSPTVTNCILWGDTAPTDPEISGSATVNYSDVEGGWGGAGGNNINADPYFVNPDSNDFHLLPDSPCLDAGDSTGLWQKGIWKDIDGKIRYFDISGVTDTGIGPVTFVDMGAYELQCSGIAGDNNCDGVVNFKGLAILCNNWLVGAE